MTKLLCGCVLIFIATEQQQCSKYKYNWKMGNIKLMYTDVYSLLMVNFKVGDIRILSNFFKMDHADLEWP